MDKIVEYCVSIDGYFKTRQAARNFVKLQKDRLEDKTNPFFEGGVINGFVDKMGEEWHGSITLHYVNEDNANELSN